MSTTTLPPSNALCAASGQGSAIPLTSIVRTSGTVDRRADGGRRSRPARIARRLGAARASRHRRCGPAARLHRAHSRSGGSPRACPHLLVGRRGSKRDSAGFLQKKWLEVRHERARPPDLRRRARISPGPGDHASLRGASHGPRPHRGVQSSGRRDFTPCSGPASRRPTWSTARSRSAMRSTASVEVRELEQALGATDDPDALVALAAAFVRARIIRASMTRTASSTGSSRNAMRTADLAGGPARRVEGQVRACARAPLSQPHRRLTEMGHSPLSSAGGGAPPRERATTSTSPRSPRRSAISINRTSLTTFARRWAVRRASTSPFAPRATIEPSSADARSVWDYPRPPRIEPTARRIRVVHGGAVIADTTRALRVLETSHPSRLLRAEVRYPGEALVPVATPDLLRVQRAPRYFDVAGVADAAWTYDEGPASPAMSHSTHRSSRSASSMTSAPDRRRAASAGGWITSDLVGPFKGGPGSAGW